MATIIRSAKEWLLRVQGAEEPVKRRWLFGLCGVSMLVVILLWGLYVGSTIPGVPPAATGAPTPVLQEAEGPGSIETFFAGVNVVGREAAFAVSRGIAFIKGIVWHEREISVEVKRAPENFILESLPVIPPVPLP